MFSGDRPFRCPPSGKKVGTAGHVKWKRPQFDRRRCHDHVLYRSSGISSILNVGWRVTIVGIFLNDLGWTRLHRIACL